MVSNVDSLSSTQWAVAELRQDRKGAAVGNLTCAVVLLGWSWLPKLNSVMRYRGGVHSLYKLLSIRN